MSGSTKKLAGFLAVLVATIGVFVAVSRGADTDTADDESSGGLASEAQDEQQATGDEPPTTTETTLDPNRPPDPPVRPEDAGLPQLFKFYGNPQIPVSLADTEVGGRSITAAAHSVRFPRSGTLVGVRPFLIYVPGEAGSDSFYHKGDGSTIELRLEADDGTPDNNPSGEVLARTGNLIGGPEIYAGSGPDDAIVGGDADDDGNFRRFDFLEPVEVEAGVLYHLVMYNTGLDPRNNFVSFDDMFAGDEARDPRVPLYEQMDFAVKFLSGDTWATRESHWAVGDYYFDDGRAFGNGYMEVGSVGGPDRAAHYVNPEQSLRQRFTPNQDLVVTGAHVGAMHVEGPNTMAVSIEDAEGEVLWTGEVIEFPTGTPTGQERGNTSVFTAQFRGDDSVPELVLRGGEEYFLVLDSVGGTHTVTATRDGSPTYNFSSDSTVVGHAELSDGDGWIGFPLASTASVRDEFDLSFYLKTANCVGCQ